MNYRKKGLNQSFCLLMLATCLLLTQYGAAFAPNCLIPGDCP